jgi:hypothetical protein
VSSTVIGAASIRTPVAVAAGDKPRMRHMTARTAALRAVMGGLADTLRIGMRKA